MPGGKYQKAEKKSLIGRGGMEDREARGLFFLIVLKELLAPYKFKVYV
jgi:hypothetical protein